MTPDDLLKMLPKDSGYAAGSVAVTSVTTDREAREAEVDRLLKLSAEGWIARQSGVSVLPGLDEQGLGAVLEAELATPATTVQIRKLSSCWSVTRIDEGAGAPMLSTDVVLVTTTGKPARYRHYWNPPRAGSAEIIACRLVAFTTFEEASA